MENSEAGANVNMYNSFSCVLDARTIPKAKAEKFLGGSEKAMKINFDLFLSLSPVSYTHLTLPTKRIV